MLFNSFAFFLFFAGVVAALAALRRFPRAQRLALLAASNFFYGYWDYRFLALLWVSILVDFCAGIAISRSESGGRKRALVAASVVVNLGILATFKYFDFFVAGLGSLLTSVGMPFSPILLEVALPVGISFYTFQSLAYSVDVYRSKVAPCRSLLTFATFVCYFPQLVAGPIERAAHLIPQLGKVLEIRFGRLVSGGLLMVWGLFKKVVAADIAGAYIVDHIFLSPAGGLHLWLASAAFGFQIYLDFSGYCDIARGASRCLGIELVENFRAPYFARNITEFWRRWHISLSSWFRDYLYIPLGGNRKGISRTYCNLLITMLLCGLWHGASAAFVIWGAYHGALLLGHRALGRRIPWLPGWAGATGSHLCCLVAVVFGWTLFRVDSAFLGETVTTMFRASGFFAGADGMGWLFLSLGLLAAIVAVAHFVQIKASNGMELENLFRSPVSLGVVAGALLCAVFLIGSLRENVPFIYFQF